MIIIKTLPVPPHLIIRRNSIACIISAIRQLDNEITKPSSGSEYHRWGVRRIVEDREVLKSVYERKRSVFNGQTLDELMLSLAELKMNIEDDVSNHDSLIVRSLAHWNITSEYNSLSDYIELKSLVSILPSLDDLYSDDKLLLKILNV